MDFSIDNYLYTPLANAAFDKDGSGKKYIDKSQVVLRELLELQQKDLIKIPLMVACEHFNVDMMNY